MYPYVLGILWALGRHVDRSESPQEYFFLRGSRRPLEVVRRELGLRAAVYTVTQEGRTQHCLKIRRPDVLDTLARMGWRPRWSEAREYPRLAGADHRDFIRAYVEIHGRADAKTIRKRGRPPYTHPRLRVYGNRHFLGGLADVLAAEAGIGVKAVQKAGNSVVSGILYFQSRSELTAILDYLYPPGIELFDREWYEAFRDVLRRFEK